MSRRVALGFLIVALAALPAAAAPAAVRAEAKPLRCGTVVKRDVRLSADLIDCPGDGLVVGRRNVSIDLNGHTIDGAFVSDEIGNGIDNSRGFDRVRVFGGKITHFKHGVLLERAARNRLSRLTLDGNHHGMLLSASKGTVVKDGSVIRSAEDIRKGEGIVVRRGSHGTRFTRMLVHDSEGTGIAVFDSDRVRIAASTVTANYAWGIRIEGSVGSAVLDSTLNNSGAAVWAERTRNTLVRGNTLVSHFGGVFLRRGSSGGRVQDNAIRTHGSGIGVSGDRNVVVGNRVRSDESNGDGIGVYEGEDNVVTDNQVGGFQFGDGIFVAAAVTGVSIRGNLATGSGDDGIDIRTPSAVLTANTANRNGDYGIEAVAGVRDGGRNRASGNGNPEQCTGVRCTSQ